jgi:hypothetical protein
MNDNIKIAWFDMDGSLFDYDGHMRKFLFPLCSADEQELLAAKGLRACEAEYPHFKARMELIKDLPGWWRSMPPLQEGFEVFQIARDMGFDCRVLTKGPSRALIAWTEKVQCCRDNLGETVHIAVVSSKSEVYGRVLYDDYPPYLSEWLEHRPRGLGIMPVNESNKDFADKNVVKFGGTNLHAVRAALQKAWDRKPKEPLVLA